MPQDGLNVAEPDGVITQASSPTTDSDGTLVGGLEKDVEAGDQTSRRQSWVSRWLSKTSQTSGGSREENENAEEDAYTVVTRNLEASPTGYARLALFQSSDRNFLLYRGFSALHCRILSRLQHEVESLETEIDALDKCDDNENNEHKLTSKDSDDRESPIDFAAGRYPLDVKRSRPEVLKDAMNKLLEYDEFALKTRDMCALQRPSKRDYESVRRWFNYEEPIIRREAQFIRRKEDIVTLRVGRECAGFDGLIERLLGSSDRFLQRWFHISVIRYIFLTPELREKCKNDDVRYYSPARIDTLVNVIITIIIFVLLILPVIILYELTNLGTTQTALDAIGVLVVFTLIFGMAISSVTTASRQELFGACAAYCAVLVVFIGNFGVQWVQVHGAVKIQS